MQMKKIILSSLLVLSLGLVSCENDALNDKSVIREPEYQQNDFDRWLYANYILPYNIDVKYRYLDIESSLDHQLIPADYKKSIQLAHLVKFLCLEAYDELTGSKEFMRTYFPKIMPYIGSSAYQNNGSVILGQAEGGRKITLFNVNNVNPKDIAKLTDEYFHTIHHEFAHILHQTIPYSPDYNQISGSMYRGDNGFDYYGEIGSKLGIDMDAAARRDGFITAYASFEGQEDFVEMISNYVVNSAETWNKMIDGAELGKETLNKKLQIVKSYLQENWDINIDDLRAIVLRRSQEALNLDVDDLTVPTGDITE